MRIAVPYDEGRINQFYGKTQELKIYEIEDGQIVDENVIGVMGQGPDALGAFLKVIEVETLICGGIGKDEIESLEQGGMDLYVGAIGQADGAVRDFLAGELKYADNTNCEALGHGQL